MSSFGSILKGSVSHVRKVCGVNSLCVVYITLAEEQGSAHSGLLQATTFVARDVADVLMPLFG